MLGLRTLFRRVGFIFLFTLALRLLSYVVLLHLIPQTIEIPAFGYEAVQIAQSLAAGHGYSSPFPGTGPTAWLTPVYPTLLAADVAMLGPRNHATLVVAILFNELCSALTVFPIFYAGRIFGGTQGPGHLGVIAAWIWAIYPLAMISAASMVWYTTLSGLLGAILLWSTLKNVKSESTVAWAAYGLLWGVELMTNPVFLVLLPPALLWLVWVRKGGAAKPLLFPAFAGLVAVLCCVPWTVRNFEVFHHFVPLRSNFGLELWRYSHDGPPLHPFDNVAERTHLSVVGEPTYMREKQHEAIEWISAHPGEYARRCFARAVTFWLGDPHPLNKFVHRGEWLSKAEFLADLVLDSLLLAGLVATWRNLRRYFWLLLSVPVLYPLVYYMTLASDLQRAPVDPILAVTAAAAVFIYCRPIRRWLTPPLAPQH